MEEVPVSLTVIKGPNIGQEYDLESEEITIGRSSNNVIVLPLPEISRRHARILRDGDAYFLEDLGSTNGTFVNSSRLQTPVRLHAGDEVQVGDAFIMRFGSSAAIVEATMAPLAGVEDEWQAAIEDIELPPPAYPEEPAAPSRFSTLELAAAGLEQWLTADLKRPYFVGLGGVAVLLLACLALALFLDAYQQGRLLYCGSLRPFFETVLGPVGFNPICP